jgi:alpha-ketoglutarate-dependent taurine dioxygenase
MAISTGTLQMDRLHPAFGAEICGTDLRQPLDDGAWAHIWEAFNEHSLLVFHGQPLTDDEQMRFSLRFGPLETTVKTLGKEDRLHPNLVELANVDEELVELATRPEHVYRHAWRKHNLVIWDNRCMLHRGRPWNAKRRARVMRRTTVADDRPIA